QMGDQQCREPTRSTPTVLNPPSRKRSGPPTGHALPLKRSRGSSRAAARRARESKETSTRSASYKEEMLRQCPRHCRDKEWDVVDLRISVEEDGSLNCDCNHRDCTYVTSLPAWRKSRRAGNTYTDQHLISRPMLRVEPQLRPTA